MKEITVAAQLVGPNVARFLALQRAFSGVAFSPLADAPGAVAALAAGEITAAGGRATVGAAARARFDAPPTAEGVSGATTRTVVTSSLAVLALDFVLTALMFRGV